MISVMGNRNLIILGGSALLIVMFVMYMMGENNRKALMSKTTQNQQQGTMMQKGSEEMTVMLSAQGNSNEAGIATLKETNGRVTVGIYLTGYTANVAQPVHVHAGTCPGVGAISYPLNSVVNGRSTTVLNASLAQMMQQLPLVINVHKSNAEISTYTSCGSL